MKHKRFAAALPLALGLATPAPGAVVFYSNQANFEGALTGSFTLVNLDDNDDPANPAELGEFPSGYRVNDAGPAATFLALGIDFVDVNAQVLAGQNGQTPTNRDRLIANGSGFNGTNFGGNIRVNFVNPVNGVGAFSNNVDFGRVRVFSAANLGGTFLGEQQFGPGGFGGLTSTVAIGSVQFTCDFNADRRCGVYDIQFGTFARAPVVPEPGAWALMIAGFGLLGWQLRRRPTARAAAA